MFLCLQLASYGGMLEYLLSYKMNETAPPADRLTPAADRLTAEADGFALEADYDFPEGALDIYPPGEEGALDIYPPGEEGYIANADFILDGQN